MGQGGLLTFSAKTSWREIASFRAFKKSLQSGPDVPRRVFGVDQSVPCRYSPGPHRD